MRVDCLSSFSETLLLILSAACARTREQLSTRFFLELPELPMLEASSDDQQQLAALAEDRQLLAVIEETLATWQQDMARNLDGMINRVS